MQHKKVRLFSRMCLTGCIFFLVSGCGTRKREVQRSEIKYDVISKDNFDASKISEKTTAILEDDFKFTLEPIDPTLPIIYRRDTIYNSKVIYQRIVRDSIVNIRDTVYIKYESQKEDKTVTSTEQVKVDSKRGDPWKNIGTPIGVGIGLAILAIGIIWILGKRKKTNNQQRTTNNEA